LDFDILDFDILDFDILDFDILDFDILDFDILDFDILDFDILDIYNLDFGNLDFDKITFYRQMVVSGHGFVRDPDDLEVLASLRRSRRRRTRFLLHHFQVLSRVARWYIFKPKIPIWVNFGGP
jgi:hypothetical protein